MQGQEDDDVVLIPSEQKVEILVFSLEELIGQGYEKFYRMANLDQCVEELIETTVQNPLAGKAAAQLIGMIKGAKYLKYGPAFIKNIYQEEKLEHAFERTISDATVESAVAALITRAAGISSLPFFVVIVGGNAAYMSALHASQALGPYEFKLHQSAINRSVYEVDPTFKLHMLLVGVRGICYLPHLLHEGLSYVQDTVYDYFRKVPQSTDVQSAYHPVGTMLSRERFRRPSTNHFGVNITTVSASQLRPDINIPDYRSPNLKISSNALAGQAVNPLSGFNIEGVDQKKFSLPMINGGGFSFHNSQDGVPKWFVYLDVDPRIGIPIFVGYLLKDDIRYIFNYSKADRTTQATMHLLRTVQKLDLALKEEFHYFNLPLLWSGKDAHVEKRKQKVEEAIQRIEEENDNPGVKQWAQTLRFGLMTRKPRDFVDDFHQSTRENDFSKFSGFYKRRQERLIYDFEKNRNNMESAKIISKKMIAEFPDDPTSYVASALSNKDDPVLANQHFEEAIKKSEKTQAKKIAREQLMFNYQQYKQSGVKQLWRNALVRAAKSTVLARGQADEDALLAKRMLIEVYGAEKQLDKACRLQAQLSEDTNDSVDYFNLACLKLAKSEDGKADLLKSLEKNPNNKDSLFLIASLYFDDKDYQSAAHYFERCQELSPEIEAQIGSASAYYQLKDFDSALKSAKLVLISDPMEYRASLISALCYLEKGDLINAKKHLENCKAQKPYDETVLEIQEAISQIEQQRWNQQVRIAIEVTIGLLRVFTAIHKLYSLNSIYEMMKNYQVRLPIPDLTALNALIHQDVQENYVDHDSMSHSVIVNRVAVQGRHSFVSNIGSFTSNYTAEQSYVNPFFNFNN